MRYLFSVLVVMLMGCAPSVELETVDVPQWQLEKHQYAAAMVKALHPSDIMAFEDKLLYFQDNLERKVTSLDSSDIEYRLDEVLFDRYPSYLDLRCIIEPNGTERCSTRVRPVSHPELNRTLLYMANADVLGLNGQIVCGNTLCVDAATNQPLGVIQPPMRAYVNTVWKVQ